MKSFKTPLKARRSFVPLIFVLALSPLSFTAMAASPAPVAKDVVAGDAPPVAPGKFIDAIYDKEGDGSSAYAVANGAWAHYWYGHAFQLNGKQYFTGFVYKTANHYGKDTANALPNPETKATIAQATFEKSSSAWTMVTADRYIGEFGGSEKGDPISKNGSAQTFQLSDGNALLAVPTQASMGEGQNQQGAELFLLDAKKRSWAYVGRVAVGEDNADNCADSAKNADLPPCWKYSGKVEFVAQAGSPMPSIHVAMQGTTYGAAGSQVRKLTDADSADYRFDAKANVYQQVKH
ncbi:hypothetical protein [Dyella sp. GSA-30]|uniref:hypothetical protein n=1 Tax=Dyella sp. GSA-30 TaxID=2994496 RepID=UPI0024931357|nr:hypothetical protein [Dyella sp. GSA-30]BDU19834.1 hypothetical protein DYGSA30_12910 [Dyella sp. GSA-30]